eukprot:Nk52_evm4s1869 gene=Nk52_evmTU4s1869
MPPKKRTKEQERLLDKRRQSLDPDDSLHASKQQSEMDEIEEEEEEEGINHQQKKKTRSIATSPVKQFQSSPGKKPSGGFVSDSYSFAASSSAASAGVAGNSAASAAELGELSLPPTQAELMKYTDIPFDQLPSTYKRTTDQRVFVNRNLRLHKIAYFGFDMDYTLAYYHTPDYESAAYELICERMVEMGYPAAVGKFKYDPEFPIRGLFFDTVLGNLLKVDEFGNIITCVHGKSKIYTTQQIREFYPNRFIVSDDIGKRFYVLNTSFNLPETCLYAELIEYFDNQPGYSKSDTGVTASKEGGVPHALKISYYNMYKDVRDAVDHVHIHGNLKQLTMRNLERFIVKDSRLPLFLDRLNKAGKHVFLVTNSDYEYTEKMMTHLFNFPHGATEADPHRSWKTYFDVIICDARKPLFFGEGTALREVNLKSGRVKIGTVLNKFERGKVYVGGSSSMFCEYTGAAGKDVLYVGDHIFGDILKSKKEHAWRTFLVVPELKTELTIGRSDECRRLYNHLRNLEFILAESYRGLSIESEELQTEHIREQIRETVKQLDTRYNRYFGSMFRSGSKQTFFAMQTKRYADLYSGSCLNLMNYPLYYDFISADELMPHEKSALLSKRKFAATENGHQGH